MTQLRSVNQVSPSPVVARPSGVSRTTVVPKDVVAPPRRSTLDDQAKDEYSSSSSLAQVSSVDRAPASDTSPPSYAYFVTLLSAFSIIAFDVNYQDSLHILQSADDAVHLAVSHSIPYEFRAHVADTLISDTPITVGAAFIVAGLGYILTKDPKRALLLTATAAVFNRAFAGIGYGKDSWLTTNLKHFFARARPTDDLHHSFSFPSGHSTCAYFVLAFLFFVILPEVLAVARAQEDPPPEAAPGDVAPAQLQWAAHPRNAALLTVAGGAVTQSGRLLADVHWLSDVLAGALWGSTGVAAACVALRGARVAAGGLQQVWLGDTAGTGVEQPSGSSLSTRVAVRPSRER